MYNAVSMWRKARYGKVLVRLEVPNLSIRTILAWNGFYKVADPLAYFSPTPLLASRDGLDSNIWDTRTDLLANGNARSDSGGTEFKEEDPHFVETLRN